MKAGLINYIISAPEVHRWHHVKDTPRRYNKNFGTQLMVWDHVFGTFYLPKGKAASHVLATNETYMPAGFWAQWLDRSGPAPQESKAASSPSPSNVCRSVQNGQPTNPASRRRTITHGHGYYYYSDWVSRRSRDMESQIAERYVDVKTFSRYRLEHNTKQRPIGIERGHTVTADLALGLPTFNVKQYFGSQRPSSTITIMS